MSTTALATAGIALMTGINVYRSCIHHRHIIVGALLIDALFAAATIFVVSKLGFLP